ncbi:MAG: PIN domain-containing protein, partial [Cyanobium sp.]
ATNQHAWAALQTFLALEQVDQVEEPPELVHHWARLGAVAQSAPKAWMDAYLAAFAIAGGYRLLTLDRDFRQHVSAGLALRVLE